MRKADPPIRTSSDAFVTWMQVHKGFLATYNALRPRVLQLVQEALAQRRRRKQGIWVTGVCVWLLRLLERLEEVGKIPGPPLLQIK